LHGDHIFGLPGLLLSLQVAAKLTKESSRQVVQVYGPVGIYNYIASSLSLTSSELTWLSVQVFELQGGSKRWQHPGSTRIYNEFRHRGLERNILPQNEDGTWTLSTATEIESETDAMASVSSEPAGEYIYAAEVQHVPKLQCFGYVIREPNSQPWKIDKDKAIAAGVRPGRKYKLLKCGFTVMSDDGSKEVQPSEVVLGERSPPRSVALLGDCYHVPSPMLKLCEKVDVLVHEATFLEDDKGLKVDFGGHSTAAQAARVADAVQAKCLFLNHIAGGSFDRTSEQAIVAEAMRATKGPTKVQLTYDHLELQLPRTGLPW
jgi:ribonuclease BN (tRNA processing enzyme)